LTTATITLIAALRTPTPFVQHVLNLETAISVIAGYFYSVFVGIISKGEPIDWKNFNSLRYLDWAITTPLIMITLCLVTGSATGVPMRLGVITTILAFNYLMLYTGYLGEVGTLSKVVAMVLGFVPFFLMFAMIYYVFMRRFSSFSWLKRKLEMASKMIGF
jgi:bacteriorhodopsin